MPSIAKLKERQKALEAKRRAINAAIKKAEEEEKNGKFIKAGQDLAEHFKLDPSCNESSKIAAICQKYFLVPKIEESTEIESDTETKKSKPKE